MEHIESQGSLCNEGKERMRMEDRRGEGGSLALEIGSSGRGKQPVIYADRNNLNGPVSNNRGCMGKKEWKEDERTNGRDSRLRGVLYPRSWGW